MIILSSGGQNRGRIHERTNSLRFLGIILSVLKFSCTMLPLQPSFKPLLLKEGGVKSVNKGDCEYQGGKLLRLLPRLTSKNSVSEISIASTPGTYPLIYLSTLVIKTIFRAQNPPLSLSPLTNKEPKITLHSIKIKSKSKVKCLMARSFSPFLTFTDRVWFEWLWRVSVTEMNIYFRP